MTIYKETVWFRFDPKTGKYKAINKGPDMSLIMMFLGLATLLCFLFLPQMRALPIFMLAPGFLWTDNVNMRAGATPQTFDGNQTIRFNSDARRLVGISMGQSQSIYTTDEGFCVAVKLSENPGITSKGAIFVMGWAMDAGPATNHAVEGAPPDYIPMNNAVSGNSTMRVDISTVAGAVQTGTHDVSITAHYDGGDTPPDILFAAASASGIVPVKGGTYGYATALAVTTETPLTGNGAALNIPAEATQIVAILAHVVLDTAVTASEEIGGKVRLEFQGIAGANKQEYVLSGGSPNLGTEVQGGACVFYRRLPMFLSCPAAEVQVSGFITFLSAITGGADVVVNLLWR